MAEESAAERNRRKLAEHLAKLQEHGGKVPGGKDAKDNARRQADPGAAGGDLPRPPPIPPGWEAWKKAHGGRLHTVREVDAGALTQAADYQLLELQAGASKVEVKRNFNRLAKQVHPDLGGDAEIFQAMQAAYKRLMKTAK